MDKAILAVSGIAVMCGVLVGCDGDPGHVVQMAAQEPTTSEISPHSFVLRLEQPTADTVTTQIVAAAHEQLASACRGRSSASVRVWNPLSSGAYLDVSCAEILDEPMDRASASEHASLMSSSTEAIGEAAQPLTVLGLACWLATAAVAIAGNAHCQKHPEDPDCSWGVTGGGLAFSTLCLLF